MRIVRIAGWIISTSNLAISASVALVSEPQPRWAGPLVAATLVGLLSACLSLGRLLLANSAALTTILWAEDGEFALCVRKAGFAACLLDPYAGYSLFVPRMLAGITAIFPLESWALVANVMAAILAGIAGAVVLVLCRRFGLNMVASVAIALLPAIAPIVGFESLNVIASCNSLLLFVSTLALALIVSPLRAWWVGGLLLITALTMPSSALLVLIVIAQAIRRRITLRDSVILLVSLLLGLGVQVWFAATAQAPRAIAVGWESFRVWVDAVPIAILTYWPGLNLAEVSVFDNYVSRPSALTGYLVLALILISGLALAARRDDRLFAAGVLLLAGVGLGAFPSLIGSANNRYFVAPCLLWAAAVLLLLEPWIGRRSPYALGGAGVLIFVIWWPAIPASDWRSTADPDWQGEVERAQAHCAADPGAQERIIFSPAWPPNWGDGQTEPTTPSISCLQLRK